MVFWVVTLCSDAVEYQKFRGAWCLFHSKDEGSKVLCLPCHYEVLQPRGPWIKSSLPWKPQISHLTKLLNFSKIIYGHTLHNDITVMVCVLSYSIRDYAILQTIQFLLHSKAYDLFHCFAVHYVQADIFVALMQDCRNYMILDAGLKY